MQKEKRFPFPSIPALKGGATGSPDSDPRGPLSVSPGDPEELAIAAWKLFPADGGVAYLVKGCPFPRHSGNDLWILDPAEPVSFRPSWFPSKLQARLRRSSPLVPRILPYPSSTLPLLYNLPPGFGALGKPEAAGSQKPGRLRGRV